ncbi:MAG: hypothetical protein J4F40_01255 [Alphaproteobacteria bacterium]|nr:hypothetical protein [Alphaproteobacteria bacterium]
MSTHRYPASSLAADHCRAGIGLLVTGGPLVFLGPISGLIYILAPLAVLFGIFAVRTLVRQLTTYEAAETGFRVSGPIGFELAWSYFSQMPLRYFTTRRDRGRGWMQLRIRATTRTGRRYSTLGGFSDIVPRAAKEAARHDIALSDATLDNMRALGIAGLSERTRIPTV